MVSDRHVPDTQQKIDNMLSGQKPYDSAVISVITNSKEKNMSPKPFVVQPEDRADPLNVVAGDKIWVLASKETTGTNLNVQRTAPKWRGHGKPE